MWNLAETGFTKFNSKKWWFLDTNCLSYIIKNFDDNNFRARLFSLLKNKPVLILSSQVQEISRNSTLTDHFEDVVESLNTHFLPDLSRLWWAELCRFWNCTEQSQFYTFCYVPGLKEQMQRDDFRQACNKFDEEIQKYYVEKVSKEIGQNIDERDLNIILIQIIINRYSQKWFGKTIPIDINPSSFKSFFIFGYTYYYRYIKNNEVKIETNDAIDLLNTIVSPYCEHYYAEKKFTNIMRQYQGKFTPSAFELAKRVFKQGYLDEEKLRILRRHKERIDYRYRLLSGTRIHDFSEFVDHINRQSSTCGVPDT